MLEEAVIIAYVLFFLEALYSYYLYLRKKTKEAQERFYTSLGVLMVALPLMLIDIADYAAKNFNVQYTLFSPALTLDFGIKAQQAANRTMPIALQISSYAALGQIIVQGIAWAAAIFTGGASLLIGYGASAGIGLIKGVAEATLRIAEALYVVGKFYEFLGKLGLYARGLVPLGLALLVSKKTRPLGGVILAIGLGFGYILPFALNNVAYEVKGVTVEPPPTGVPSIICVHIVTGAPLPNGTYVYAGFPAVVEYQDLDRANRTVVRPVGCFAELTGRYRVTRIFIGAEPISYNAKFTVKPLPPNASSPFNTYDDMFLQKIRYPDLARLADLAGNNFTFTVIQGPLPSGEKWFVAFWDPYQGYYAYVATDAFSLVPINVSTPWYSRSGILVEHTSGETAKWYNYTYFPLFPQNVMIARLWGVGEATTFTKNVTIVRDGKNYTVTVNCTRVIGKAYGSVEKVEVIDPGLVEINGTTMRPEVETSSRSYYVWNVDSWRKLASDTFNKWFNQTARVINNTFIDRNLLYVSLDKVNNTIRKVTFIKVEGQHTRPVASFYNPYFYWVSPPRAPQGFAIATYCGRVVRPATFKLTVNYAQFSSYPVKAETITMLSYDPLVQPFVDNTPLTVSFREEARNFIFGVYPFIFMFGVAFALSLFSMDAISGFFGGAGITIHFLPGRFRQAYWDIVVSRIGDVVLALAGANVPSVPWLGERLSPVVKEINENLRRWRREMPLAIVRDRALEAVKATITWRNLAKLEDIIRARIDRLLGKEYVPVLLDAATKQPIIPEKERELLTVRLENLARRLVQASYEHRPLVAVRLSLEIMKDALLSRNRHTVDAFLGAVAGVLRREAMRTAERSGIPAYLHPTAGKLLKASDWLELARVVQNPYAIYHRVLLMVGISIALREKSLFSTRDLRELNTAWHEFFTEYALLTAIRELGPKGYSSRASELIEKYAGVWSESIKAGPRVLEILENNKGLFEEARKLIREALGKELLKAGLTEEIAKDIYNLSFKRDEYINALGTPAERMKFETYSSAALSLAEKLDKTGSPLLKAYADALRQDVAIIRDIYSEEVRRVFYDMADAWLRASASARGEIAKMLGEVDPRFRELWRSGGEPLKFNEAFDRLVDSLDPGVKEPVKSFVEKVEDYIYLRAIGADQKELERVKQELLDSYRATLLAMGLRAELYKLDLAELDKRGDAFGDVLADYFSSLERLAHARAGAASKEAEEARREAEYLRAVALVDQLRLGLLTPGELREKLESFTGAREFLEGALASNIDEAGTKVGKAGYLYLRIHEIPRALEGTGIDLGGVDLDRFLAGVEDYIDAVLNGRSIDPMEAGVKAMEEPQDRDYWAGLGYAAMLVEYGEQEANQWIVGLYPSAREKEAEVFHKALQAYIGAEDVARVIDYAVRRVDSIEEKVTGLWEELGPLREGFGGFAEGLAKKEALELARESAYNLMGRLREIEVTLHAVSENTYKYGLGDEASRVLAKIHELKDALGKIISWIDRVLGEMNEHGGA